MRCVDAYVKRVRVLLASMEMVPASVSMVIVDSYAMSVRVALTPSSNPNNSTTFFFFFFLSSFLETEVPVFGPSHHSYSPSSLAIIDQDALTNRRKHQVYNRYAVFMVLDPSIII